ncbi:hypothetical protein QQG55_15305 [Brugia pahangi]
MSIITLKKIGIYFLPWLFSIVVNYSTATVLNRFYHFDNDGTVDDEGTSQWFFAKPAFIISKKQMSERIVNSLLRNAWIG